ncbi:MAG: hypothetical protein RSD48_05355, partial [Oscillospiraceae bacterium]
RGGAGHATERSGNSPLTLYLDLGFSSLEFQKTVSLSQKRNGSLRASQCSHWQTRQARWDIIPDQCLRNKRKILRFAQNDSSREQEKKNGFRSCK